TSQRLSVRWNSFICAPNINLVDPMNCVIIGPERSLLNANITYSCDMSKLNVNFAIFMARSPNNYFRKIINFNVDICKFYKNSHSNRFFTITYKMIFSDTNLIKKCPQPKGWYYIRNMDLGPSLPQFLPASDFKAELNFVSEIGWMMNISLIGRSSY
ncbi:hypothetical protein KR044_002613, partial [Drosophila immigrans]